jgi:hypothetical protein
MLQSHKPITCTIAHFTQAHYTPLHATCKLHMCMFTVHSGCVYVHAACLRSVHDGIIHALITCLSNVLHVACPVSGMQVCSVCACMWVACMHAVCGMHVCVVCIHMACRHAWGVYSGSALFVAKQSYHIGSKISLNYIVNNVKSGNSTNFNLTSALMYIIFTL